MEQKQYKLLIQFSVNDGIEEEHEIFCSEEELEEEINNNIIAISTRQDAFISKWEELFPPEECDRIVYNKIDSEGYYQDGYLFMRKIDLRRGFFEGRLTVIEINEKKDNI